MKKILFAMFVLTALALSACGSGTPVPTATLAPVPADFAGKTNPLDANADAIALGAKTFKRQCETCHGETAHGDGPASVGLNPRPGNLVDLQKVVKDDYIFWRISAGKEGTAMVAWKGVLKEEQIWQIVAFLHTLK